MLQSLFSIGEDRTLLYADVFPKSLSLDKPLIYDNNISNDCDHAFENGSCCYGLCDEHLQKYVFSVLLLYKICFIIHSLNVRIQSQ